jgi:hypothetical protein
LKPPSAAPVSHDGGLVERYEELRRQFLEHCGAQAQAQAQAQGLALFMRRGMGAWMQAWSQCAAPSSRLPPAPSGQQTCPVQLHAQVAALLVDMVLLARQEILA